MPEDLNEAHMPSLGEIRKNAKEHRENKNYEAALPLYEQLWQQPEPNRDKWDGWGYAFCLRKLERYPEALEVCREVWKMDHAFVQNNGLYGWCLYHLEIALQEVHNEPRYLKAADAILRLVPQDDQYGPYILTVIRVLDYLDGKAIYPAASILEWTGKLNPELLSTVPYRFKDEKGKERELASQKERYYMMRSKALLESEMYEECIAVSKEALDIFESFHYSNDSWFARRISISHKALGKPELALQEMLEILKKKKEWFIQMEIAELFQGLGKTDEAMKYAVEACLNFGDMEYKMNLYMLMANLLKAKGMQADAAKHVELVYHIKRVNEWKMKQDFEFLLQEYQVDTSQAKPPKQIFGELKKVWEKLKFGDQKELTGIIKSLLPGGKTGFVELHDKKSFFFLVRSFKGKPELLKPGLKVTFILVDAMDPKKNVMTKNAENIRIAKS